MKSIRYIGVISVLLLASYICCQNDISAKPNQPIQKAQPQKPVNNLTPQYNSYVDKLRNKIINGWLLPDGKNVVTVSALVAQDGSVSDLTVTSSPTNNLAEQAASDAFNQAQPFPALPSGPPSAKITLVFESTADPHGDSNSNLRIKLDPVRVVTETQAPQTDKPNP